MVGFCEHTDRPSGSIKAGVVHQMSNYQLLKEDSGGRNYEF
jgi:hypothetical protein